MSSSKCGGCESWNVCALDTVGMTPDSVTKHYACILAGIYLQRTAGSHTFTGVLAEYNMVMARV